MPRLFGFFAAPILPPSVGGLRNSQLDWDPSFKPFYPKSQSLTPKPNTSHPGPNFGGMSATGDAVSAAGNTSGFEEGCEFGARA